MIEATVTRGYGVASGSGGDPRFPGGTLRLQFPFFAKQGLDLSDFYPGTINLDITPASYEIIQPKITLTNIKWHPDRPAETFSFFDCQLGETAGLIYYPHPETKPEHFQPASILEVLAPKIEALSYGQKLKLTVLQTQLQIIPNRTD